MLRVRVSDLVVPLEAAPSVPRNSLASEILNNLRRFPHCILLTRVGQFYEVSRSFYGRYIVPTGLRI